MSSIPLADTLLAVVTGIEHADRPGLTVTEATLDVPLEGSVISTAQGPLFHAGPAHTLWRTGFLAPLFIAHIGVTLQEAGG
jgi:hypothetical protein